MRRCERLDRFARPARRAGRYTRIVEPDEPAFRSVSLDPNPVIEAYKKDVDRTLIREQLRRTVDARVRNMIAALRFAEGLHEPWACGCSGPRRAAMQARSVASDRISGRPVRTASDANPISIEELRALAERRFGDMVKAVVDLRRDLMVLDADLHADQEAELLASGSRQEDLWGITLYPELSEPDWLEFDSMINLRPSFGNRSRGVDDPATRDRIGVLVGRLVRR